MQNRCVNMIAHLFNAPVGEDETAIGVGTVGSSEAIMLAGLAFKRKWQKRRREEGKTCDKPNIVTGANVQVGLIIFSVQVRFSAWFYIFHSDIIVSSSLCFSDLISHCCVYWRVARMIILCSITPQISYN